jgi:hypothetical protein
MGEGTQRFSPHPPPINPKKPQISAFYSEKIEGKCFFR